MSVYEIPLSAKPQSFGVTLGTTDYRMRLTYCDALEGGWILDIGDTGGNPLICGIPLITGLDLLAQYRYLGIPGRLFVSSSGGEDAVPTFTSLGGTEKLYFEILP